MERKYIFLYVTSQQQVFCQELEGDWLKQLTDYFEENKLEYQLVDILVKDFGPKKGDCILISRRGHFVPRGILASLEWLPWFMICIKDEWERSLKNNSSFRPSRAIHLTMGEWQIFRRDPASYLEAHLGLKQPLQNLSLPASKGN